MSEQAGHDFWLTRGHYGCGFWETSDWEESAGELLTDSAHAFGECHVYIGESDGKVHIQ